MNKDNARHAASAGIEKVRLDKWLWAARLFKTRAVAKDAVEGGKVSIEGNKPKPGKEISIGTILTVRQGYDEKTITVTGLIPAEAEIRAYPVTIESEKEVLLAFDLTIFLPDGTIFDT